MQRSQIRPMSRSGFTLLEILIVVAIIGVIAAMVVPRLLGQQRAANIRTTRVSIKSLESTMDMFASDNSGTYPNDVTLLMSSYTDSTGVQHEPLLDKIPKDAWQRPLNYQYPNSHSKIDKPAIWSSGPDGSNDNGSNDDINNWSDLVQ